MLPLHTHATVAGDWPRNVLKVLKLAEALVSEVAPGHVLIDLRNGPAVSPEVVHQLGFAGVLSREPISAASNIFALSSDAVVQDGDVIRVQPSGQISVLFRREAKTNFLFVTERCNSFCLMCSQPPRNVDDQWRVRELLETIALVDPDIRALGLTGGEPTLLGDDLASIIRAIAQHLPDAQLNVLTNARLLSDRPLADRLTQDSLHVLWAVPLYGPTAHQHDYVVQAQGAFDETLLGLYNLAERKQAIEIRCVVHKQTVEHLVQLAEFIWRNLPFAAHVAFMGLEPMGFAKANRNELYIDPLDYQSKLEEAVWYLHDRGIHTSIYNTPLCLLSRPIWNLAKQSISDWKNDYPDICSPCSVKDRCSGFFKSAGPTWRSRGIQPIMGGFQ